MHSLQLLLPFLFVLGVHSMVHKGNFWQCFEGQYVMPGVVLRSVTCKENTLTTDTLVLYGIHYCYRNFGVQYAVLLDMIILKLDVL